MAIRWHEEDPILLREAIRFTSAELGFVPRLIEKDYFCSVLLQYLAGSAELTFKGGTCLSKIHSGFYRLSEDLDFSISTLEGSSRESRSRSAEGFKAAIAAIPKVLPAFRIIEPSKGANSSSQYSAVVGYGSLLDSRMEPISVEVGLREPVITKRLQGMSKTVLLNPLSGQKLVETFTAQCLSYSEAMAEKMRAALCRREIAIRDFFDIQHAVKNGLDTDDPGFLGLVKRKVTVPGTGPVEFSAKRMDPLSRQLDAQLRPVLRDQDFSGFDLSRAIATVRNVAQKLA